MHKSRLINSVQPVKYIEWVFGHFEKVKYNLGLSNIASFSAKELGINLSKITSYTPRLEEINETIGKTFNVSVKNILSAPGATLAYYLLCRIILKAGDEVIIERPTYEPLVKIPQILGAKILRLERKFEERYEISTERFKKIINKRTKLIVITKLHNPTGIALTRKEIQEIKLLSKSFDGFILFNEVYAPMLTGELSKPVFLLSNKFISISSFSKAYGLSGLKIGWAFGDERIIKEARNLEHYYMGYLLSSFSINIALQVFPKLTSIRHRAINFANRNWKIVEEWLIKHSDCVEWITPDGGVMCFPRFKKQVNVSQLTNKLISKYSTLVTPGSFFEAKDHMRIGFGCKQNMLHEGLRRFSKFLKENR